MSRTWSIELSGTITRDVIWLEVDAETEQKAIEIVAMELPTYRVRSIISSDHSLSYFESTPSPPTREGT